jgi:NADH:ubiquinone oxidoreductase subunit E
MEAKIRALLEELPEKKGALILLLQGVQSELGYISQDAFEAISEALEISESEVYGVATFYSEYGVGQHDNN